MRNILLITLLLLCSICAYGQGAGVGGPGPVNQPVRHGTGAPSSCPKGTVYINDTTGAIYSSINGVCGSAIPSSGLISGSGTTGRIAKFTSSSAIGNATAGTDYENPLTFSSPLSRSTNTISCPTCGVTGSPLSQFAATTSAQLRGVLSDENGTGVALFDGATSPTFVSPTLGAATATSINGNFFTAGTFTLTGAASKTLTFNNTLTLSGTDGSTLNVGAGGTLGSAAFTASTAYEVPLTFSTGLTRSTNTVTVNTAQNIATLSNLTTDGFVKTSGSNGTLSVDTSTYLTSSSAVTSITGTANQVTASAATGAVTLSLPQSIATSSTPQLAGLGIGASGVSGQLNFSDVGWKRSAAGIMYASNASSGSGIAGAQYLTATNLEIYGNDAGANSRSVSGAGGRILMLGGDAGGILLRAGWGYTIGSAGSGDVNSTADIGLFRNAAGVFEVDSGTVGTFRDLVVRNLQLGGTAARATTAGTNRLDIFDGTAPVGTLANGISLYSTSGELRVMDAAGNATLLSPHDHTTNEWIFYSVNTTTGQVLRIDMERMMRDLNARLGGGYIHESNDANTLTTSSARGSTLPTPASNIGGTHLLTPTAGATVTLTIDPTATHVLASWTAGEAESVVISGTPQDGAILTCVINNDGLLGRTITFGTGLSSLSVAIGVISKKSTISFVALNGTFIETSRTIGF